MKVIVRAFNAEGYHKDLLDMDERQVWSQDRRVGEPAMSMHSGLIGVGGAIDPKDFPEMVRFEVVLEK